MVAIQKCIGVRTVPETIGRSIEQLLKYRIDILSPVPVVQVQEFLGWRNTCHHKKYCKDGLSDWKGREASHYSIDTDNSEKWINVPLQALEHLEQRASATHPEMASLDQLLAPNTKL
nr:hypothetical protein Iba_scaffold17762CG0010 [Ipomoea batatas]